MSEATGTKPEYIQDLTVKETFSDIITAVSFDGANVRIEFSVTRIVQEAGANKSSVHPAARLVLPLNSANELMQKVGSALAALEKQGALKRRVVGDKNVAGRDN